MKRSYSTVWVGRGEVRRGLRFGEVHQPCHPMKTGLADQSRLSMKRSYSVWVGVTTWRPVDDSGEVPYTLLFFHAMAPTFTTQMLLTKTFGQQKLLPVNERKITFPGSG